MNLVKKQFIEEESSIAEELEHTPVEHQVPRFVDGKLFIGSGEDADAYSGETS